MSSIDRINRKIKRINPTFEAKEENMSIVLTGRTKFLKDVLDAGYMSFTNDHLGVVNRIELEKERCEEDRSVSKPTFATIECDCLIIGATLLGISVLKELSKYELSCVLIDSHDDVMEGEGTLNERIAHSPIDYKSMPKSRFYSDASGKGLDAIIDDCKTDRYKMSETVLFKDRIESALSSPTIRNMIKGKCVSIKSRSKLSMLGLEPDLVKYAHKSIDVMSNGIVNVFQLGTVLLNNAMKNGSELYLNAKVLGMIKDAGEITTVITDRGSIKPRMIINCAGLFSDEIADLAYDRTFTNIPYKRTVFRISPLFPRKVHSVVYFFPKDEFYLNSVWYKKMARYSKYPSLFIEDGFQVFPLPSGELICISSTKRCDSKRDLSVSEKDYDSLYRELKEIFPSLKREHITSYSSILVNRTYERDRLIRVGIFTKNIIETAGIDDSAVAMIPKMSERIVSDTLSFLESKMVIARMKKTHSSKMESYRIAYLNPPSLRDKLIKSNPRYGEMIIGNISRGDIEDILNRDKYLYSLDGLKRRLSIQDTKDSVSDFKIEEIIKKKRKI